jgi:uncharacterized protein
MRMWLGVSVLGGLLACTAAAVDWTALKPLGSVSDFAGVLGAGTRSRLDPYLAAVERSAGTEVALVTLPSLDGEPVDDVARTIYRAWDLGARHGGCGVLLLFSIRDRRASLVAGPALAAKLPAGLQAAVLREMRPALRAGRFDDAFLAAADTIGDAAARAAHARIGVTLPRRLRPSLAADIPWLGLLAALLTLLLLARARRPRGYGEARGWWSGTFRRDAMNRATWGARGSGGFGGFDSADSFGAFGGDSGGRRGDW